ncbi:enoyl-CoA hydratase/isomerase family protein [Parasedimentitalea maritima]|uniref:Enoyl-CoA hydratase/isomerase family protein n=1 Tax=Parasedimentitalea maritima TaxID=2578117 RepID=A0ABY2UW90_9RHOB|nr:enoyl-CoA hydratase/isomerase family protein [Zongyanglinia marina]TLP62713.1 enoyl-CoA hydratase/isomerase family protein [Zongyanglinia marina]
MSAVHLEIQGAVATIRLDNPAKLNALDVPMLQQIDQHCQALELRDDIRVVLVTGTGTKAFCTGADIKAWASLPPAQFARSWVRDGHRIFDRLARLSKPTIAVLNGHTFGGGLELAAACDIRVMRTKARIALPEAGVGIVPGWSGTQRLARLLPEPLLKEMALFGRQIEAGRIQSLGFVAEVADEPMDVALEIAARAAELSPRATEITKNMIHVGVGEDRPALIEALGSAAMGASDDRTEGVSAFSEKRTPDFSGR